MKRLTIEELENNFEEYLDKVEQGESYLIENKSGNVVLVKYDEEELLRIYTDHDEAS
jgi:prevent-host-death family protein